MEEGLVVDTVQREDFQNVLDDASLGDEAFPDTSSWAEVASKLSSISDSTKEVQRAFALARSEAITFLKTLECNPHLSLQELYDQFALALELIPAGPDQRAEAIWMTQYSLPYGHDLPETYELYKRIKDDFSLPPPASAVLLFSHREGHIEIESGARAFHNLNLDNINSYNKMYGAIALEKGLVSAEVLQTVTAQISNPSLNFLHELTTQITAEQICEIAEATRTYSKEFDIPEKDIAPLILASYSDSLPTRTYVDVQSSEALEYESPPLDGTDNVPLEQKAQSVEAEFGPLGSCTILVGSTFDPYFRERFKAERVA